MFNVTTLGSFDECVQANKIIHHTQEAKLSEKLTFITP